MQKPSPTTRPMTREEFPEGAVRAVSAKRLPVSAKTLPVSGKASKVGDSSAWASNDVDA